MLRPLIYGLIALIAACPAFCGSEQEGRSPHNHHASEAPAPAHCPSDGDCCICQGAVQADGVRLPAPDALGLTILADLAIVSSCQPHVLTHLTPTGSPAGLAGWGDLQTVRAVLQNFRC